MEPQAIAKLERISPRSYEGRHRRAMAALREAVAGLDLGAGCGETRRQLRRRLGGPSARQARAHVETCMPCLAFERRLRGALSLVPLSPTGVALELMIRPAHGGAGAQTGSAAKAGSAGKTATGGEGRSGWAKALRGRGGSRPWRRPAPPRRSPPAVASPRSPRPRSARPAPDRTLHTLPRHSAKLFLKSRVGSSRGVR